MKCPPKKTKNRRLKNKASSNNLKRRTSRDKLMITMTTTIITGMPVTVLTNTIMLMIMIMGILTLIYIVTPSTSIVTTDSLAQATMRKLEKI